MYYYILTKQPIYYKIYYKWEFCVLKNNGIEKVKNSPLFLRGDIAIYLLVIIIVLGLFLFPLLGNKTVNSSGFCVLVENKKAVTFYNDKTLLVENDFIDLVETQKNQSGYFVKIYSHDKKGYNVIFFDTTNLTAKVVESNCSASKDCVHFPELKDKGTIYCAPHQLKISILENGGFTPPIAGGI